MLGRKKQVRAGDSPGFEPQRRKPWLEWITLVFVILIALGGAFYVRDVEELSDSTARNSKEADRQSQIAAFTRQLKARRVCVNSTNPFRRQMRDEFEHVKTRILRPVFEGVAATLPSDAPALPAIELGVMRIDHRVATLHNRFPLVDCSNRFPLSDDPRTAEDEAVENAYTRTSD